MIVQILDETPQDHGDGLRIYSERSSTGRLWRKRKADQKDSRGLVKRIDLPRTMAQG